MSEFINPLLQHNLGRVQLIIFKPTHVKLIVDGATFQHWFPTRDHTEAAFVEWVRGRAAMAETAE